MYHSGDDLGMVDFSCSMGEKEKERDDREREREPLLWSGDVLRLTQVYPLSCLLASGTDLNGTDEV